MQLAAEAGLGLTVRPIGYSWVQPEMIDRTLDQAAALGAGILMFNLESAQELEVISQVAGGLGVTAPVGLRVNPDVDAQTHPKITTGLAKNKFGLDVELALEQYRPGDTVEVTVRRGKRRIEVPIELTSTAQ